jgi:aspartate dehydrogenase
VVADPGAERTRHVIEAEGTAGRYRFEIDNLPSAETPTTSAVVPFAVLRAITDLAGTAPSFR